MRDKFTGRHMTIILVAFFGTVIAVNMAMARLAVSGFGGTVVDNSYVASQKYNDWLAEGRRQRALGWKAELVLNADRRLVLNASDRDGRPLANALVTAVAQHPVGLAEEIRLRLDRTGTGRGTATFIADRPLPRGRWSVKLSIRRGDDRYDVMDDIQ